MPGSGVVLVGHSCLDFVSSFLVYIGLLTATLFSSKGRLWTNNNKTKTKTKTNNHQLQQETEIENRDGKMDTSRFKSSIS